MNDTLASNLIPLAMPEVDDVRRIFLPKIKSVMDERLKRDVYLFDLKMQNKLYAVTLLAQRNMSVWILTFNHTEVSNERPLVLKVYPGYRIGVFYSREERIKIADFFGRSLNAQGSFRSLLNDINNGLIFRRDEPTEFNSRKLLLELQDTPEEADKIYFKTFKRNKKIRKDGTPSERSVFNSWKTQTLLPWVWEQIKNDPSISVIYTTSAEAAYQLAEEERLLLRTKLQELLSL